MAMVSTARHAVAGLPSTASGVESESWLVVARQVLARTVLWALATLIGWAIALIPLGFGADVIISGSMTPRIGVGDVVVTKPIGPHTELLGRVVTADNPARPGTLLTHRIITTFAAQAEGIGAKQIVRRLAEETKASA